MIRTLALAGSAALLSLSMATPAAAQSQPMQSTGGERVNQVIIYGDDECPESTGDTITVCARLDESERYRIPANLRLSNSPQNESWSQRVQSLEAVGDFGPLSCTPVGAGAELGCTLQMIERAYDERASSSSVRFAELIAEERRERLATIDTEAALTQAQVEELERAELERRRLAQGEELPDENAERLPEVVDPDRIPDTPPPN